MIIWPTQLTHSHVVGLEVSHGLTEALSMAKKGIAKGNWGGGGAKVSARTSCTTNIGLLADKTRLFVAQLWREM